MHCQTARPNTLESLNFVTNRTLSMASCTHKTNGSKRLKKNNVNSVWFFMINKLLNNKEVIVWLFSRVSLQSFVAWSAP